MAQTITVLSKRGLMLLLLLLAQPFLTLYIKPVAYISQVCDPLMKLIKAKEGIREPEPFGLRLK